DAAEYLGSLSDRARLRDRLPQLDREEQHPLLGRRHGRLHVPTGRDPGERRPHRPGLLQARVGRRLFGGYEGNFEGTVPGDDGGCVDNPFRWCDNLSNNDPEVLTWMSKTFAYMVAHMANDTQVFDSAKGGGGHVKKDHVPAKVALSHRRPTS